MKIRKEFKYVKRSVVEFESSILNVDTVQERSEILVLDDCGLLDSGTDLGDFFQIDRLESDVVFFFFLLGDEDSFWGFDSLVHLESQEVLNFNGLR
jgi:hypothetical protein